MIQESIYDLAGEAVAALNRIATALETLVAAKMPPAEAAVAEEPAEELPRVRLVAMADAATISELRWLHDTLEGAYRLLTSPFLAAREQALDTLWRVTTQLAAAIERREQCEQTRSEQATSTS